MFDNETIINCIDNMMIDSPEEKSNKKRKFIYKYVKIKKQKIYDLIINCLYFLLNKIHLLSLIHI